MLSQSLGMVNQSTQSKSSLATICQRVIVSFLPNVVVVMAFFIPHFTNTIRRLSLNPPAVNRYT